MPDPIPALLQQVDPERLRATVHYLTVDPLPFRKCCYTRPGQSKCSLYEADDYLQAQLESSGYTVEKEGVQVQSYRCDSSKPKAHQYSPPAPEDPWYTAYNLYAKKTGTERPEEIIVVISHKDSQSWVDSPGANDNAVGTAGNLELARVLAQYESPCSLWFIFCNEEHSPWTSVTAAGNAAARGDRIRAVFNCDGLGRKSEEDTIARRMKHVCLYTEPEGEAIADLLAAVSAEYGLPLEHSKVRRERPGDDDGSYVKAGYKMAIANIGSYPYADPEYHTECDSADRVDVENAALSVQAILATVVRLGLGSC